MLPLVKVLPLPFPIAIQFVAEVKEVNTPSPNPTDPVDVNVALPDVLPIIVLPRESVSIMQNTSIQF